MCALFSTDPTRSVGSGAGRALPAPAAPYSRCPRVKWVNPPVDRLIGLPRRDCGPQTRQRPSNALSSPRRQRWRCVCVPWKVAFRTPSGIPLAHRILLRQLCTGDGSAILRFSLHSHPEDYWSALECAAGLEQKGTDLYVSYRWYKKKPSAGNCGLVKTLSFFTSSHPTLCLECNQSRTSMF